MKTDKVNQKQVIGEDNICPVTNLPCDDECCSPGSECNVSGGDGISPVVESGERKSPDKLTVKDYFEGIICDDKDCTMCNSFIDRAERYASQETALAIQPLLERIKILEGYMADIKKLTGNTLVITVCDYALSLPQLKEKGE